MAERWKMIWGAIMGLFAAGVSLGAAWVLCQQVKTLPDHQLSQIGRGLDDRFFWLPLPATVSMTLAGAWLAERKGVLCVWRVVSGVWALLLLAILALAAWHFVLFLAYPIEAMPVAARLL